MYGKMMIEELKRFFNTDELKPSIVVLDVGVFFPYANQDILKFDILSTLKDGRQNANQNHAATYLFKYLL